MLYRLRTVVLLGALVGLFLVVGYLIGGQNGMLIALVLALVMNFFSYWYSDKIVLFMYKAKEADREKYAGLYSDVSYVAERAHIPVPRVFIVPSAQPNAFATGRNPKNAVVAVTEGIVKLLNERELKGVIAHEMAHIKNRDILISSLAAVIAGAISYLAHMAMWAGMFGGFGSDDDGGNVVGLIALAILTPLIAALIHLAISRSREFLADKSGAKFIRDPNGLADALQKLHASPRKMGFGSEGTSHMFIVKPFKGKKLVNLFSTHPPVSERVGKLRSMAL